MPPTVKPLFARLRRLARPGASSATWRPPNGYARRTCVPIEGVDVNVIGFEDLLVAKRAAGRPQDLVDVSRLEKVRAKEHELGRKRGPSKDSGRDDSSR